MKTFVVCNRTTTKEDLAKMIEDIRTTNPKDDGWIKLIDHDSVNGVVTGAIFRFIDSIINRNSNIDLFEHYRGLVVIMDTRNGRTVVWAKNNAPGRPLETVKSILLYSVDNSTPVIMETSRVDILEENMRCGSYVNWGIRNVDSIDKRMKRFGFYRNGGVQGYVYMDMPLLPGVRLERCCITHLVIVPMWTEKVWTDYCGDRYQRKEVHYLSRSIRYNNIDRISFFCPVCSRRIIDDDVKALIGYTSRVKCRECLREEAYREYVCFSNNPFPDKPDRVIPPTSHVKQVDYLIREEELHIMTNVFLSPSEYDAYLRVSTATDNCEYDICNGFDDVLNINITVKNRRKKKRDGRIVIYVHKDKMISLLYIKERGEYRLYGRVLQGVVQRMVSEAAVSGSNCFTTNVIFAKHEKGEYTLRHPVSIKADIANNYNAVNKIKKMYAASLLKGETV